MNLVIDGRFNPQLLGMPVMVGVARRVYIVLQVYPDLLVLNGGIRLGLVDLVLIDVTYAGVRAN